MTPVINVDPQYFNYIASALLEKTGPVCSGCYASLIGQRQAVKAITYIVIDANIAGRDAISVFLSSFATQE